MIRLHALRTELGPTIRLALPLVLAELGWMSMGIVDTVMVGHLPDSATAMGAVSLSSNIFIVLALFGGGLLLGLDTIVAQAFGAGQREDCHRSLLNGIYLSIALTPLMAFPTWFFGRALTAMGIAPPIIEQAVPYMRALVIGLFPLLLYFAVRRTLQAMNMVKPVAFALISANLVNAFFNWVLIYGKWGFPAMGTVGSGWSTAIARAYMAAVLVGYLLWYDHRHRTDLLKTPVDIDLPRIRRLIMLGLPAAMQFTLESGVFATVTALIARLGAVPLASHQIALNTVAFTYMVPLGISSAAAVRVGQAIGRKDPDGANDAGTTAIFVGAAFMAAASVAPAGFPSLDRADVHAGRNRDSRHRSTARRRRGVPTLRRNPNRRHRRPSRRRRHSHADALPSHRLLGDRSSAGCMALLSPRLGSLRPMGGPESGADSDRYRAC